MKKKLLLFSSNKRLALFSSAYKVLNVRKKINFLSDFTGIKVASLIMKRVRGVIFGDVFTLLGQNLKRLNCYYLHFKRNFLNLLGFDTFKINANLSAL